jgi:hypothetical protein
MTAWLNRCPHCRSSLPASVGPHCPQCGHLLRTPRGAPQAEQMPPPPGPVDPPAMSAPALPWEAGASSGAGADGLSRSFPPRPPPRAARRRVPRLVKGLAAVGAFFLVNLAVVGAREVVARHAAMGSPARDLVTEPCAQYRELSLRLKTDKTGTENVGRVVAWMNSNMVTFDRAALLDPKLSDTAGAVHWLSALFADPARAARTSLEEVDSHEEPLKKACTTGPGQV